MVATSSGADVERSQVLTPTTTSPKETQDAPTSASGPLTNVSPRGGGGKPAAKPSTFPNPHKAKRSLKSSSKFECQKDRALE